MFGTVIGASTRKRCTHCRRLKRHEDFHRDRARTDGLTPTCKRCNIARSCAWMRRNREQRRAYHHEWYLRNRDVVNQQALRWRRLNPEKRKQVDHRYHAANADRIAAYARERFRQNRPKILETCRQWRRANPGKCRQFAERRRRRLHMATRGRVDLRKVYARHAGQCGVCDRPVPFEKVTWDHIVPLSRSGLHAARNLQPTHRPCNALKATRSQEWARAEWRRAQAHQKSALSAAPPGMEMPAGKLGDTGLR